MRAVPALLLVLVATVTAPSSALECYACRPRHGIASVSLSPNNVRALAKFPTCDSMAEEGLSDKFKQMCHPTADRVCAKFVDPQDDKNIMRTCFAFGEDGCKKSGCYCPEDLCNSAAGVLGSVVMMVAAFGVIMLA